MTLIKTSLLNGVAVIIKMLTLLGINKVLAVYVGPSGYAALGTFQNALQMITTFASGGIFTGVTKYTAEYHDDIVQQRLVWQTAGAIAMICSIITSLLIALLNQPLAKWLLKDPDYSSVFLWLAATLVLFTFNSFLLAVLNGKKDIGRYVLANISGSCFALVVTGTMVVSLGLYGALVSLVLYQSISFFVTLIICCKASWFSLEHFLGGINGTIALNLLKFSAMTLTSIVCVPVSHILVRNHLGVSLGWEEAGYWEAIWRLSSAYLMVATMTLSVYFLPRFSELKESGAIRKEIFQCYQLVLPFAAFSGIVIYLLRDFIIASLFTANFSPMRELFAWQMLGDSFKIGSWVMAYLMLSKAMFKLVIVSEVVFSASFVVLTWLLIEKIGLKGVSVAHAINYLLYWGFVWRATSHLMSTRSES